MSSGFTTADRMQHHRTYVNGTLLNSILFIFTFGFLSNDIMIIILLKLFTRVTCKPCAPLEIGLLFAFH